MNLKSILSGNWSSPPDEKTRKKEIKYLKSKKYREHDHWGI